MGIRGTLIPGARDREDNMGKKPATKTPATVDEAKRVRFSYLKAQSHRVVHADGVIGGIAPRGNSIVMSFFNERVPIPREVVHSVNADGSLGDEIVSERVSREGVVREVETTILIEPATARQLHEWLGKRLEQVQAVQRAMSRKARPRKRKKAARPKRRT